MRNTKNLSEQSLSEQASRILNSEKLLKENVQLYYKAKKLEDTLPGRTRKWFSIKVKKQLIRLKKLGQAPDLSIQILGLLGAYLDNVDWKTFKKIDWR